MSTILAAIPGYGLTREILSRRDVLTEKVRDVLARATGNDLTDDLMRQGKWRVVPHFDALPLSIKRLAGASAVRTASFFDAANDAVWIDANRRFDPGFAADVIATSAFAHPAKGDDILSAFLQVRLTETTQDYPYLRKEDNVEHILRFFNCVNFLLGARTQDTPHWQRGTLWSMAVAFLEKQEKPVVDRHAQAHLWRKKPTRETLAKIELDVGLPADLALLRLADWRDGKLKQVRPSECVALDMPNINPMTPIGVPLDVVTKASLRPFPSETDWFGQIIPEKARPSALRPYCGPAGAIAQLGGMDSVHFSPENERPVGSYDVRPAALLRAFSSLPRGNKLPDANILTNHVEAWGENEATAGSLFPIIETIRETRVLVTAAEVAGDLTQAWLSLTLIAKSDTCRLPSREPVIAHAAMWAHEAAILRADTPLTAHLAFWGQDILAATPQHLGITEYPEDNTLPLYRVAVTVKFVKELRILPVKPYVLIDVDWGSKTLANVPIVLPAHVAANLKKGDHLCVRGLFTVGAIFPHTKEARREHVARNLPPTRNMLKKTGRLLEERRNRKLIPCVENQLFWWSTYRPRRAKDLLAKIRHLANTSTPAGHFLAIQGLQTLPSSFADLFPTVLGTLGQLVAAGHEPTIDWLTSITLYARTPNPTGEAIFKAMPDTVVAALRRYAVNQGDHRALLMQGVDQLTGCAPASYEETLGLHWVLSTASRGFVPARLRAAQCFALGEGVPASMEVCLKLIADVLKEQGNPDVFALFGTLQLMGADYYRADVFSRRKAIVDRVRTSGRTGDWVLLILHLLCERYPKEEGKKPIFAALRLATWLTERSSVTTAAPLIDLAKVQLTTSDQLEANAFDAWGWLKITPPQGRVTFAELINPLSDTLSDCLQGNAFFEDLAENLGEGNEASFLSFVETHLVPMQPGLAKDHTNPTTDGVELAAYLGISDTPALPGTAPALACIRASDKRHAGQSLFFPFFPDGLGVTYRIEEAYATADNAAGFIRIEVTDENGFPLRSIVAFDPIWPVVHEEYDPFDRYDGTLCGVAENIFVAPPSIKQADMMNTFDDTLTEAPAGVVKAGLYACGGKLETIDIDYDEIAGVAMSRVLLTIRLGKRCLPHFPVYLSKARLTASFPDGLPAAGTSVFAEVNLHCLATQVHKELIHESHTLQ